MNLFNKGMLGLLLAWIITTPAWAYEPLEEIRILNRCVNCYLVGVDLQNLDMTEANLQGSRLDNANLRGATLYKANLSGVSLKGADLTGALWVDGVTICKKGSIGRCLATEQP
ncbi:MAG: pentapeptide repeat-containing protein [bacterium]|nr:pentapeptide repeat-containing protein [bacterium]